jgi:hypothetical protein
MTHEEWTAEGIRRFGADQMTWRFVCPSCGHVASVQDWKDVGAKKGEVAYSCVGRHLPDPKRMGERPGPCDYAGGGLFRINPVNVTFPDGTVLRCFDFADAERRDEEQQADRGTQRP